MEKIHTSEAGSDPAQRLRLARKSLGKTQAEFASRLGWKWTKIQSIELKKQKLTMDVAYAIQKAWGVSAEWLLTGREPVMVPGPLHEGSPNGDSPVAPRELYEVVHDISGRATIVTAEEIDLIHKLLRILRSEDPGIIQAITASLTQFERFSRLLNARFGDIILLERRTQPPGGEAHPRRRASDSR
jgi:transcriptional regulator with XRE-family HTH domain